ncbi:unnamed protein product, partial [Didymodactylos carnosus]
IACQPKLKDTKQVVKVVNDIIKAIKSDFLLQNPNFRQPILFDLWWIDTDGHLHIVIQTTEIYVYLCKKDIWPKEVDGIKILDIFAHKDCTIKCHHCQGNHISTDYKCPVITEFRGRLIEELKRNPERLPPDVQLFIPSSYRNKNDRSNII